MLHFIAAVLKFFPDGEKLRKGGGEVAEITAAQAGFTLVSLRAVEGKFAFEG